MKKITSNSSAFFKTKAEAERVKKRLMKENKSQVRLRIKRTTHLTRGKGWLLYA